jgi:3-hydroxybutyryl-CoA dehydrogenase
MEIKKLMMVGSGFMGSGIAQVSATAGYKVHMFDITEESVGKAKAGIEKALSGSVKKGKLSEEQFNAIMGRITTTTNLADAKDYDLVIEAIVENLNIKVDVFKKLDEICPPETIFASNTSSIPISQIATALKRPDKFIGMHFFSPVPVMKLVEIIKGLKTSEETCALIKDLTQKIGKVGVIVKDGPGFLVNRVNSALIAEANKCLLEGVASIEDIDEAIRYGMNMPMGPFELGDFVGLDVALAVSENMYENTKNPMFAPFITLNKLVISGDLGRKTGKGWYDYTSGQKKIRDDVNI